MIKRFMLTIGTLVIAAGTLLGMSGVSAADTQAIEVTLHSQGAPGMCLDATGSTAGSAVVISWCHPESSYKSQRWDIQGNNIVWAGNGRRDLCIDLRVIAARAPLVLSWCHFESNYTSQKWVGFQGLFNIATLTTSPERFCWDLPDKVARTPVILSWCHYDPKYYSQQWESWTDV